MQLWCVTLTGSDNSVQPEELASLAADFPFVEFGILMCRSFEGRKPGYPSRAWPGRLCRLAERKGLALSGHLCGKWASEPGARSRFTLPQDRPEAWAAFRRIQLNRSRFGGQTSVEKLREAFDHHVARQIILQTASAHDITRVRELRRTGLAAVALFDRSNGRGKQPKVRPPAMSGVLTGYAGGLSPESIHADLDRIDEVAAGACIWIDMQSSLKSRDNRFEMQHARQVLEKVAGWRKQAEGTGATAASPTTSF